MAKPTFNILSLSRSRLSEPGGTHYRDLRKYLDVFPFINNEMRQTKVLRNLKKDSFFRKSDLCIEKGNDSSSFAKFIGDLSIAFGTSAVKMTKSPLPTEKKKKFPARSVASQIVARVNQVSLLNHAIAVGLLYRSGRSWKDGNSTPTPTLAHFPQVSTHALRQKSLSTFNAPFPEQGTH